MFGVEVEMVTSLFKQIPLYGVGLGWFIPVLIGGVAGYAGEWMLKHAFGKTATN